VRPTVETTRFQFRLPAAQRARLEDLAAECGLSAAALTSLALLRLFDDPAFCNCRRILKPEPLHDNRADG
jgi:hypothetical protein